MISRKHAWAMWLVASIFYAYQHILRVMLNVMIDDIMDKFQIDTATFGQLTGVYYLGYSLIHLPLGLLLDRFGPKHIMPIFMGLTVLGMLPFVYSDFWIYPILGRALIGVGSSAAILGAFKIIRIGFREDQFARMLSSVVTIGLIGGIYGGAPLHYLRQEMGFTALVNLLMALGSALTILTFLLIPAQPAEQASGSVMQQIKQVFSNGKAIIICLLAGLMVGPLEGFADVWGTKFLKIVYQIDGDTAAGLPSWMFVGMCFGAPVLSLIAEKTGRYFATIIASAVLMCLGFVWILSGDLTVPTLTYLFVGIGFLSSYQIIAIYKAATYAKEEAVGMTTALANMIIMMFGYMFHSVIGQVVQLTSNVNATEVHSAESFVYGIAVIPVALAIAALGFTAITLSERGKK